MVAESENKTHPESPNSPNAPNAPNAIASSRGRAQLEPSQPVTLSTLSDERCARMWDAREQIYRIKLATQYKALARQFEVTGLRGTGNPLYYRTLGCFELFEPTWSCESEERVGTKHELTGVLSSFEQPNEQGCG
jgi:hypothetical protein